MPSGNRSLNRAKLARADEFYTQISDIENELKHYRKHFKGKIVFCNCDDPQESNFWKYFQLNFEFLGLKKLIATHYEREIPSYKLELEDGKITKTRLLQNGDFRSSECIEILKEADIIVTNPPFSLITEYIEQLISFEKHFIIIAPYNAIKYKEVFPLFMDNKIWMGYGFANGNAYFSIPRENAGLYKPSVYNEQTGLVHFRNCCWITNLDIAKRNETFISYRSYKGNEDKYPQYVNYDAIEVSKVADIPSDYYGNMGVPITFLSVHNPEQFEIVGMNWSVLEDAVLSQDIRDNHKVARRLNFYLPFPDGKGNNYTRKYDRLVIRRKG